MPSINWSRRGSWRPNCLSTWSYSPTYTTPRFPRISKNVNFWENSLLPPQQLHLSEWSNPIHLTFSRQDDVLLPYWSDNVPYFFFQSNKHNIRVVLLPTLWSLHNFTEVTEASLTQYVTHQEAKRSNYHLLSVKMRTDDSLKSYINFFQSQHIKVSNCGEEVSVLAFISGLQVTHSLYKYLLKHNVIKMSEALSRAQSHIQLEEAIKASSNNSAKPSDNGIKLKSTREVPDHALNWHRGQPPYKKKAISILLSSPIQGYMPTELFTYWNFWSMKYSTPSNIDCSSEPEADSPHSFTTRVRGVLLLQ